MIFCTIGTTRFPFYRLIQALDQALVGQNEPLILQTGECHYALRYADIKQYKSLPYEKLVYYMSHSQKIICHGGAGTVLLARKYAHVKPFVVPRLAEYKEHVDNHQKYFSEYMRRRGDILMPHGQESIVKDLRHYITHPPLKQKNNSDTPIHSFITRLVEYTNSFAP